MSHYGGVNWDHEQRVRTGSICTGHLSDAVFNAMTRTIWEHRATDDYYGVLIHTVRGLMAELLTVAAEHQGEWTQFLQEALVSAGETCRGPKPDREPAYRTRWQHDADLIYERLKREAEKQSVSERESVRARLRRWEQQRDN